MKNALLFLFLGLKLTLSPTPPDYRLTCAYVYENLDERAKEGLPKLLGKKSLEEIAVNMTKEARDSIDHYVRPLNAVRLAGPYKYAQLDSVLRPLNLDILNGIKRFDRRLKDNKLTQNERIFALQVLIGLHTAMESPLAGVADLAPRDEFLKHDIFSDNEAIKYGKTSLITLRLYDAYKLGVRVAQAAGNQQMIRSFRESGYKTAGRWLAGSLKEAFKPEGILEIGEGPNWGKVIEPGQEPIYYMGASPTFPGGYQYFPKFMNEHLHYPAEEWGKGMEGTCYVQIVVEKNGTLSHIKVVSPVTPGIDSEAVRVIRLSPKWQPGTLTIDGPPVRSQWTCIVNFRIKPGEKREDVFNIPFHDMIKPKFPGGKSGFEKYIRDNNTYIGPPFGRITLHYLVEKSGKVTDVEVLRKLSPAADAEAIRLLKQSPAWIPGSMGGSHKTMMGDTLSVYFRN